MPCGYCDRPGHRVDQCPERLERYYGTIADDDADEEGDDDV